MIRALSLTENKIQFRAKKENYEDVQTELQPETIKTKFNRNTQKIMSAFVDYPIKGLTGDINADFYEFLSMGTIPYVIGSIMFMSVFNITKHLDAKGHKTAGDFGRRMAMGVLLYALFKSLSKNLVVTPIKWATGVNTEMPYQNKVCDLPQGKNEDADVSVHLQQRTVL